MFNRSLQQQITQNALALTTAITELKNHIDSCDKRTDRFERKLEKFDSDLTQSGKDRESAIHKLEDKLDQKHSENRRFLYGILASVVVVAAERLLSFWVAIPSGVGHH